MNFAGPTGYAQTIPPDHLDPRGTGWIWHDLGDKTHCLYENSGNAAALYRPAPQGSSEATSLFIYISGGGSCNSSRTCTGADDPNAIPKNAKDGYSKTKFENESKLIDNLYLRTSAPSVNDTRVNPFMNMNMAMVPYCTGDSHTGNQVRYWKYTNDDNVEVKEYFFFAGNVNFKKALTFYKGIYPDVTTIYLMGASAGAGGAVVQLQSVRETWGNAQVHLLEDAAPVVPDPVNPLKSIITWQAFLPGCPVEANMHMANAQTRRSKSKSRAGVTFSTATARNTTMPASKGAALNVNAAESEPLPYPEWFGPAAPFLGESGEAQFQANGQVQPMDTDPDPTADGVPVGSCTRLQQTREYNRNQYSDFRYGIMSFKYDNVLKPNSMSYADYDAAITTAAANVKSKANPALTHTLFVDNTRVKTATGKACGRHVVTNFNYEPFYLNLVTTSKLIIQDKHYEFITKWISGAGWSSILLDLDAYGCPTAVNDGLLVVF